MEQIATLSGLNVPSLELWLAANVPGIERPVQYEPIAGGRSNLTFRATDVSGRAFVIRRPPLSDVLATAHDMGREHKIIQCLGSTRVPVPATLAYCEDPTVTGAAFYGMEYVPGLVLRSRTDSSVLTPPQRAVVGMSVVDTLAEIHAVDTEAAGLGDLGPPSGYMQRQLARWHRQYEAVRGDDSPAVEEVHRLLGRAFGDASAPSTLVHGDFKLDNCLIGTDMHVAAVLDWELSTIGDPLADLGLMLVYWNDPEDPPDDMITPATTTDGFPRRADLLARYADKTAREIDDIHVYMAFGYWKLACIVAGVYARYVGGAMGVDGTKFQSFREQIDRLASKAEELLRHG